MRQKGGRSKRDRKQRETGQLKSKACGGSGLEKVADEDLERCGGSCACQGAAWLASRPLCVRSPALLTMLCTRSAQAGA